MFDISVIPMQSRNRASIAAHLELYNRTMDTCRVHNPTDIDFIVYNDRKFANEKYLIPNVNRDIGFGKGNNDVPRFIADRYLDQMGTKMISELSKKDWDEKKMKFRLEERGQMEERLAIRTNDPKMWDKVTPILFLGVVKRYQSDIIDEPDQKVERKDYTSNAEAALDRLELRDQEIGVSTIEEDVPSADTSDLERKKNQFLNEIQ